MNLYEEYKNAAEEYLRLEDELFYKMTNELHKVLKMLDVDLEDYIVYMESCEDHDSGTRGNMELCKCRVISRSPNWAEDKAIKEAFKIRDIIKTLLGKDSERSIYPTYLTADAYKILSTLAEMDKDALQLYFKFK